MVIWGGSTVAWPSKYCWGTWPVRLTRTGNVWVRISSRCRRTVAGSGSAWCTSGSVELTSTGRFSLSPATVALASTWAVKLSARRRLNTLFGARTHRWMGDGAVVTTRLAGSLSGWPGLAHLGSVRTSDLGSLVGT